LRLSFGGTDRDGLREGIRRLTTAAAQLGDGN